MSLRFKYANVLRGELWFIACEMLIIALGQDCAIKSTLSPPRITTVSTLSTSFPITCPSVSKVIGFLGKPGSNTGNFYQTLINKFTSHLGGIQFLYSIK